MTVNWEPTAGEKFDQLIAKVPAVMRSLAQNKVSQKAAEIITKEGRELANEKDLVDAFFEATPFGFHGPMKCDMEAIGLDYTRYGYQR